MSGDPSNLPKPLAPAKAPRLSGEAFADLQRRAALKGLRLTRSESNGETRVWLNGREVLTLDELEVIIVHAASAWDVPLAPAKSQPAGARPLTVAEAEREQRECDARMVLGAAALAGAMAGMTAGAQVGASLLASLQSMNAAETVIDRAKRNP